MSWGVFLLGYVNDNITNVILYGGVSLQFCIAEKLGHKWKLSGALRFALLW